MNNSSVSGHTNSIAVLTPVFNDPIGLARTLASLRSQNISFDWILVDDGSLPHVEVDTEDLPFCVHCINLKKNLGITRALNTGLKYILDNNYDFIVRLDAGDVALPDRFQLQLQAMQQDQSLGVIGSWVRLVDPNGQTLLIREMPETNAAIRDRHKRTSGMVHSSVMIRTDVIREVGTYREEYPYAEDFDLWLRIHRVAMLANVPKVLLEVEVRPNSISTGRRKTQVKSRIRLLCREFNLLSPGAYVGLLTNCLLYMTSFSQALIIKKLLQRVTLRPTLLKNES